MVDVVGPRPDGTLVAAAAGRLFLVDPDGSTRPFGSYSTDPGPESYIAMAPGLDVTGAGCRFEAGEIFALELGTPPLAIVRVTVDGQASRFVQTPPADLLTGIAFDATGRFGNQLLVAGRRGDRTVLFAIDCRGRLRTVTDSAPVLEGGMAVAPVMFGQHGGDLIAVDENSGNVIFIRFDGTSGVLVNAGLAAGPDIGVGSVGFIPVDFLRRRGTAYVADRRSPGSPTVFDGGSPPTVPDGGSPPTVPDGGSPPTVPDGGSPPTVGTDGIWRLTPEAFRQVRIDENDLVVASEADGRSVVVRCRMTCRVMPLGLAPGAHIEGHITVVLGPEPPQPPRAGRIGTAMLAISTGVIIVGGFILFFIHNRRNVQAREPDRL